MRIDDQITSIVKVYAPPAPYAKAMKSLVTNCNMSLESAYDEPSTIITGNAVRDITPTISCSEKLVPLTFLVIKYVDVFPKPIPSSIR